MRLKVLSFNIRNGLANDGENGWQYRKDACAELIRAQAPDVAGLQEVFEFQNIDLIERLPGYHRLGVGREDGVLDGEFCTVLYRDKAPLETGTFWFSETPEEPGEPAWGARIRRICTWAKFEEFTVCNVHTDHESPLSRLNASKLLLSRLPDGPTIITGDFNAGENTPEIEALRSGGLRDTYRVIHPDGACDTFHGFTSTPWPDKIDYIWVSHHWDVLDAALVTDQPSGRWPSDHFAITATLAL